MTTYTVLYPINRDFLESRGAGCALGAPVKDDCQFGTVTPDSILYNGGFILTTNDVKSQIVMTKNPDYWDANRVYLDKVTYIYDEGQDPYSIMKGFEAGIYPQAALRTTWEDYQTYLDKYIDNAYYTIPNAYSFGVVFNFNRQIFDNTNYATDEAQKQNTREAILNVDFRRALRASIDLVKYLGVGTTEDLAKGTIRNLNNFPEAGTQSDGTLYFDAVTKAYNEATGENRNLNDGEPTFFSKEEALAYIEKAKEAGIEFPVHLDMLVPETSDSLMKRGSAFKQTVSDNTDGQIIIELVTRPLDLVQAIAYENSDPAQADYDISTFTGWGPDYADPKSFVDTYSPTTGYYMTTFGLGTVDQNGAVVDEQIKEQVGFMEYEKLYREADAIVDDMDARYQAFAKADAYLVEQVLSIPTSMQARGQVVSNYVPFSGSFSNYGVSGLKYKGLQLQDEIVTVEQRKAAEDEWNAGKGH